MDVLIATYESCQLTANTAPSLESRGPNFAAKKALNIINTFILGVVYFNSSPPPVPPPMIHMKTFCSARAVGVLELFIHDVIKLLRFCAYHMYVQECSTLVAVTSDAL